MAIIRTYLYDNDSAVNMQNVCNYLLENAVDKYFDSVEAASSDTVNCYLGEKLFLKINISGYVVSVTLYGTTDGSETIGYTPSAMVPRITYAYKCENSISFCATTTNSDTMNCTVKLTITKDDAGNTVIICVNYDISNQSIPRKIFIARSDLQVMKPGFIINSTGQIMTAKVPFFVGNTENYTPDVFLLPYVETSASGIITMNGINYVSNGLWCCKE